MFFLLTRGDSLTPAFAVGALATVPQVVLPRMIRASGKPEGKAADAPVDMRSRCTAVMEGLSFIIHHPLLPGLYGAPHPSRPPQLISSDPPLPVAELIILSLLILCLLLTITLCSSLAMRAQRWTGA